VISRRLQPIGATWVAHCAVDHREGSVTMTNVHDFLNRNLHEGVTLASARASSFKMSAIQWLWPNRFALGKLGILAGLPDEGKGQVFANMAATVSQGGEWPCGEGAAPQGNVLLLTAEDDIEDTVVPRLVAAGADLDRIEIVKMVRDRANKRMFSLVTDLELLRQKIVGVGDVKLVQIDPITAYLGNAKMDSYRTNDVRAVLSPVVDLAAELRVAIIAMMHFNKKLDVNNALLRISDSLAYGATARHVYAIIDDAENKRKLMVKGKNNIAPKSAADKALAYRFGAREVGQDEQTGKSIWAPHIIWEPDHVDMTASQAMAQAANKSSTARDEAKKFLADLLAAGAMPKAEIEEAADANGIKGRTLFRAKDELGITAKKDGPNGSWRWHLPPSEVAT
jgi:putative DNA primase/helicase